jgi:hypothetical protein
MFSRDSVIKLLAAIIGAAILMLGLGVLLRVPAAAAQATSANLSGTVVDEAGAVVPDVKVTLMSNSTGFQRQTSTDAAGHFVIPLLPPGAYTLTAEMPGFASVTVDDVVVQVSINSTLQIVLVPSALAESIDVAAEGQVAGSRNQIDITNATAKYSVTNEQVISLPVLTTTLGRNTLGVLPFLVPGVSPATPFGSAQSEANRRGNQMSINGSRPSSISFNFEGGDDNDHELNQAAAPLPNPDVLQEFTVITSSYQADLGRSSGGIINAVAKSGTSRLGGNLRYFVINEALNARGFFDTRVPLDRMNTFGGQVGGPLALPGLFKGGKRTFFFFDYEGTRSNREALSTLVVPGRREREGDFSHLPVGERPIDPLTKKRFPDGIIPKERFNPISLVYLDRFIPLPNDGERTFRQLLPTGFQNDQLTARFDHRINSAGNLSVTFFSNVSDVDAGTARLPVGSKTISSASNHNLVMRETHILSPRTVNQLTATLTRFLDARRLISPGATGVHPSEIGFTGIHPQSMEFIGVPSVIINGMTGRVVTGEGSDSAKTTWQLKDDLSYVGGEHTLKLGGELRGFIQNTSVANNNGSFTFSGFTSNSTRSAIGDFLLGIPAFYTQTSGSTRYPRQQAYYFYVMDDWRARPNLTLNAGLRYELVPTLKDEQDQVNVFRPGRQSERFPAAPAGLLFVGDPDPMLGTVPRGGYPADKNNFAPRLGVAYSPAPGGGLLKLLFGENRTALRAGGGLFYDQTYGFTFSQFTFAQPFSISQTINSAQMAVAGSTFANPFGSLPNQWPVNLGDGLFTAAPQIQPFDPAFRTAYTYQYNLTIQRELPLDLLVEVAYVGNNSFKLNRERELNTSTVRPGSTAFDLLARKLYPQFGRIPSQESTGRARYDSLQVRLTRRFAGGLSIDGSYVYGKSVDDGSGPLLSGVTDPFRRARSSFDRTHSFVASYTYSLGGAGLGGVLGHMLGGWQVAGITEMRSGMPMDIFQESDTTLTGAHLVGTPDYVGPYVRYDPREYRTIVVDGVSHSGNFYFDPNAFRPFTARDHTQARPGTLGRNMFDGPGINLWSFSIIRRIPVGESRQIIFRSDIRNVFNRAHFQLQSSTLQARADLPLGQVLSAAPGRNVQLSVRFSF